MTKKLTLIKSKSLSHWKISFARLHKYYYEKVGAKLETISNVFEQLYFKSPVVTLGITYSSDFKNINI